jgi:hypothetical protein
MSRETGAPLGGDVTRTNSAAADGRVGIGKTMLQWRRPAW